MRLYEFIKGVDVEELQIFDMHEYLKESKLLESLEDVKEYRKYMDDEQQYSVDTSLLQKGTMYAPVNFNGAPEGQFMLIGKTRELVEFTHLDSKIHFADKSGKPIQFPITNGIMSTFIFNTIDEREQFLTATGFRFAGWRIKTYHV
jgi:hypothetical protein